MIVRAPTQKRLVLEFRTVVAVQPFHLEWKTLLHVVHGLLYPPLGLVQERAVLRPAGVYVRQRERGDILACGACSTVRHGVNLEEAGLPLVPVEECPYGNELAQVLRGARRGDSADCTFSYFTFEHSADGARGNRGQLALEFIRVRKFPRKIPDVVADERHEPLGTEIH